ncbi:MAG TPA: hypothetical protein VMZ50_11785 [Phycisphaerae bacterium]|nr:hypothetical protein [Phycisphaerae bacterium]
MGCCGGRKRRGTSGERMLEPARRGPTVANYVPRAAAPPTVPGARAIQQPTGGYEIVSSKVCPECGARLIQKNRWSDRLRRHYRTLWCSTCKEARG